MKDTQSSLERVLVFQGTILTMSTSVLKSVTRATYLQVLLLLLELWYLHFLLTGYVRLPSCKIPCQETGLPKSCLVYISVTIHPLIQLINVVR